MVALSTSDNKNANINPKKYAHQGGKLNNTDIMNGIPGIGNMIVCVLSNKSALHGGRVYFKAVNKGKKKIVSIFYHNDKVDHFFLSV